MIVGDRSLRMEGFSILVSESVDFYPYSFPSPLLRIESFTSVVVIKRFDVTRKNRGVCLIPSDPNLVVWTWVGRHGCIDGGGLLGERSGPRVRLVCGKRLLLRRNRTRSLKPSLNPFYETRRTPWVDRLRLSNVGPLQTGLQTGFSRYRSEEKINPINWRGRVSRTRLGFSSLILPCPLTVRDPCSLSNVQKVKVRWW